MANAVAWIGQDGNLWYKGSQGVQNWGAATGYEFTSGGIRSLGGNALADGPGFAPGVDQIADPVAPAPANNAPAYSAPVRVAPTLNQAAVNNTSTAIDQIPRILQAALEAENQRYGNTVNDFNTQEGTQRKTYEGSTVTNQKNYDATYMDSIRAGIKGLGGLMALLRGTGASGGTVDDTVRDTVGGVTAQDIRGGADTRNENQGTLDSSLSEFLTQLGVKRRSNEDVKVNNERAIRRDADTQLQDLYGKMAGYYGDAEQTANRDWWMARAGEITPRIADNTRTQVSPYDTTPVAVQAPQLAAFAGPTQPNVLAAPADGQVGSGIFTMSDRRRKDPNQVPVLAGA